MRPDSKELLRPGGLNPTMCNAEVEGGPRNGVMTALEDFLAEHDRPFATCSSPDLLRPRHRRSTKQRLGNSRSSATRSTGSKVAEGLRELLQVRRVDAAARADASSTARSRPAQRRAGRAREPLPRVAEGRAARRALSRERDAPEVPREVRRPVGTGRTRSRPRSDPCAARRVFVAAAPPQRGGRRSDATADSGFLPYTAMGEHGSTTSSTASTTIRADAVPGDLVECGTGRGGAGIFMRGYLDAHELPDRTRLGRRRVPGDAGAGQGSRDRRRVR